MLDNTLLIIFTGVLAVAVLIQSIVFYLIYKCVRQLTVHVDGLSKDLRRNAELVTEKVNESLIIVKDIAQDLKPITEKLADTSDIVHKRVQDIDSLLEEITNSARLEMLRVQETFHDASRRIQDTIDTLRDSIAAPINEISAISRAIRVAINVLFRRRKNPSGAAGLDEEMFI
jgi:hypothetical protein